MLLMLKLAHVGKAIIQCGFQSSVFGSVHQISNGFVKHRIKTKLAAELTNFKTVDAAVQKHGRKFESRGIHEFQVVTALHVQVKLSGIIVAQELSTWFGWG